MRIFNQKVVSFVVSSGFIFSVFASGEAAVVDKITDVSTAPVTNGETVMFGDSITWQGRKALARLQPDWKIDGVIGRPVSDLSGLVESYVEQNGSPDMLVVALGSNPVEGWRKFRYREAANMVSVKTKVIFVSMYASSDYDTDMYGDDGSRHVLARRYSKWVNRIAKNRPNTVVVPWRRVATRNPELLFDGLHTTKSGQRRWAKLVSKFATRE